jgi:hypothetical protein
VDAGVPAPCKPAMFLKPLLNQSQAQIVTAVSVTYGDYKNIYENIEIELMVFSLESATLADISGPLCKKMDRRLQALSLLQRFAHSVPPGD